MAVRLITYDLNKESTRPKIVERVKAAGTSWAKLSESSYAITTNASPLEIYNYLKPMLDANDNLYVVTLSRPYYGRGPQEVNDWLERNLPR